MTFTKIESRKPRNVKGFCQKCGKEPPRYPTTHLCWKCYTHVRLLPIRAALDSASDTITDKEAISLARQLTADLLSETK